MDGVIGYLNTDLVLTSADDLTALAAAFKAGSVRPLYITRGDDEQWYAVESLDPPLRSVWAGCSGREFNIGYDCGLEPWAFNQGLSAQLLGRMAAADASLRITLYPNRDQSSPNHALQQEVGP